MARSLSNSKINLDDTKFKQFCGRSCLLCMDLSRRQHTKSLYKPLIKTLVSAETSPELKTYLAQAASRLQDQPSSATNQSAGIQASKVRRNILTLTLDNTPIWSLPTLLQAHPSFPWPSKKDSRSMLCKADFVCKLFCFLTGADLKF